MEVPTKNGLHLICTPFDIGEFNDYVKRNWLEIPDVHKNNPTLLYFEGDSTTRPLKMAEFSRPVNDKWLKRT